jgi:hypothetical protein
MVCHGGVRIILGDNKIIHLLLSVNDTLALASPCTETFFIQFLHGKKKSPPLLAIREMQMKPTVR